ncbi:MAG: hypothetical protein EBS65_14835 [Betaproteobacteria bacterium]|nr:hypothetical protein [Betaproteobacteria bacterium]
MISPAVTWVVYPNPPADAAEAMHAIVQVATKHAIAQVATMVKRTGSPARTGERLQAFESMGIPSPPEVMRPKPALLLVP